MIRALFALLLLSCATVENAASKDPMRCERDPNCASRSEKSQDCATQCANNPDCMNRCSTVQSGIDRRR